MFNWHHYTDRAVPVFVLTAYGQWRYSIYHVNQ